MKAALRHALAWAALLGLGIVLSPALALFDLWLGAGVFALIGTLIGLLVLRNLRGPL